MKIFLIGFMGSGKTTCGNLLAEKSSARFLDMDEMIEKKSGMPIAEIFRISGEADFRKMEREVLYEIIQLKENLFIATGGGTPCFYDNMELINKNGTTVYLKLSQQLLYERLSEYTASRPLISGQDDLKTFISETLAEREKYYLQTTHIIEVGESDTIEDVCNNIQKFIRYCS